MPWMSAELQSVLLDYKNKNLFVYRITNQLLMQLQSPMTLNYPSPYSQYPPQQLQARQFLPPPNQIASQTPLIRRPNQFTDVQVLSNQVGPSRGYVSPPHGGINLSQQPRLSPQIQQRPSSYLMYGSPQIYGAGMRLPGASQFAPHYGPQPPQPIFLGHRLIGPPRPYEPIHPLDQNKKQIDFHIQQDKVHCVICDVDYPVSGREQHVKKHQRVRDGQSNIKKLVREYKEEYTGPQTRPIVEPEEYNIQYNPNSYIVEQIVNYSTPEVRVPPPPAPPMRTDFGVGTSDAPAAGSAINRVTNDQPMHMRLQPETVRLTTDGQEISVIDPNAYNAARVARETQNTNPSFILPQGSDSRFVRDSYVTDQPVQPMMNSNTGPGRQTLQPMNNIDQSQNLKLSSAPKPTNEKVQITDPDHFEQFDALDSSAYKNGATQSRKYNSGDYNNQSNISQPPPLPPVQDQSIRQPSSALSQSVQGQPVTYGPSQTKPDPILQSMVNNYVPQPEEPLPIIEDAIGDEYGVKRKRLPKSVIGL